MLVTGGVVQNEDAKIKAIATASAFSAMLGASPKRRFFGINALCRPFIAAPDWRRGGRRVGGIHACLHDRGA